MEKQDNRTTPSFPAWRHRLEHAAELYLQGEVQRFLEVLRAVGTPLIEGLAVHFLYSDPRAQHVAVTGEFTDWGRTGVVRLSLEHSGFSQLCHKALERLSDDTTHFIICCEPRFMSHWCKMSQIAFLSIASW